MAQIHRIKAFCLPLNYQGHQLLGTSWPECVRLIQASLAESGLRAEEASSDLFVYTYDHPAIALTSLVRCFDTVRKEFKGLLAGKEIPLRTIFHLEQGETKPPAFTNPASPGWDILRPEAIYVTRQLKGLWEQLTSTQQLPKCLLKSEGDGLSQVEILDRSALEKKALLSARDLPLKGSHKECFYCGMTSHPPAACPSKYLTADTNGLARVGYIPFPSLDELHKKSFTEQGKLVQALAAGITPEQLRKDPLLQVFVGFLDVCRFYQLRFLWNITFNIYTKWEHLQGGDKLNIDNTNLRHGLDCLRVGDYGQAEEFLLRECKTTAPKRFYATIGLAFLGLEMGRLADMGNHLETAYNLAVHEKERIYVTLLLSRYYDLMNEPWKARDAIKNIISFKPDCVETQYRKIQLEVRGNFTDAAYTLLRTLSIDNPELFMTILLDPIMAPIQSKVDDILTTQHYAMTENALANLNQARNELDDLKNWFPDHDKQMAEHLQSLAGLEKKMERRSYFDVRDVSARAKGLFALCGQLRTKKLDELYHGAKKAYARWSGYHHFWIEYPYRRFFRNFIDRLLPLKKNLLQVQSLAKKNKAKEYQEASALLDQVQTEMKALAPLFERMNYMRVLLDGVVLFGRKILLAEVAVATFLMLLVAAGSSLGGGEGAGLLARLGSDAWFQKRAFLLAILLIAPCVALCLTLAALAKK